MTESEAIEWIKKIYLETNQSNKCISLKMAISALSKQKPKKPIEYGGTRQGLDNDGNCISSQEDYYSCHTCESFLGYVSDCEDEKYQYDYCPNCGQHILWGGGIEDD